MSCRPAPFLAPWHRNKGAWKSPGETLVSEPELTMASSKEQGDIITEETSQAPPPLPLALLIPFSKLMKVRFTLEIFEMWQPCGLG